MSKTFLAICSAFLLSAAFPPFGLGFLAYIALVPFLFTFPYRSHKDVLLKGFLFGLTLNSATLYWIAWPTIGGGIFSVLFLSLYLILFAFLLNLLIKHLGKKGLLFAPFLWTSIEYLLSFGELAFPWVLLGNTQTEYTTLIQFASITGVYGISLWVSTINLLIFWILKDYHTFVRPGLKEIGQLTFLFLLFIIPYLWGKSVIPPQNVGGIKVAMLQPNIPIEVKWGPRGVEVSFKTLKKMTLKATSKKPDLIIWPETATPCYLLRRPEYKKIVRSLSDSLGIPILTGSPDYRNGKFYNSAFLFLPSEDKIQGYDKIHLVPGSEKPPFLVRIFPFLLKLAPRTGRFTPGVRFTVFKGLQRKFSVLICFESIFPDLTRKFVSKGAEFLVNITNDAWFGKTSGPYQHAQIAVLRAIENRIPIARTANTGVSMLIDPYGRVSKMTGIFQKKIVIGSIPPKEETTFFSHHGNLLAKICAYITLGLFIIILFKGLK